MPKLRIRRVGKKVMGWTVLLGIMLPSVVLLVKKVTDHYVNRAHQLFTPEQATCKVHDIFNNDLKNEIIAFISQRTTRKSLLALNPQALFDDLKDKFSIVKTVEWRFLATKTLDITIIGHTPSFVINDQLALGQENQLFETEAFQDFDLTQLPHITVNSKWIGQTLKPRVARFLHKIESTQLKSFKLSYHQPWLIELTPHQSLCKCRIMADEKSFFRTEKFDAINNIFQDLCQHGLITKKTLASSKPLLTFDIRFKKQVVVKFSEPLRRGTGL